MKNNSTPVLNEIRKNILGYGIKNTFRSTQQFVEEICEDGYGYTKFEEDMQSFISEKEALKALKKTPDNRYELDDFSIVKLWGYLPEEDVVDAFLTCLKNDAFQKDEQESDSSLTFRNGENRLVIFYEPYGSDVTDEYDYSSREAAEEAGFIMLEDGLINVSICDDYDCFSISRHDNTPRFDELEKEVVKLVKATFNVK